MMYFLIFQSALNSSYLIKSSPAESMFKPSNFVSISNQIPELTDEFSAIKTRLVRKIQSLNFLDSDDRRAFPVSLHSILVDEGMFGMSVAPEKGGLGLSMLQVAEIVTAVSSFDVSAASMLVIHNLLALPCIEKATHLPDHDQLLQEALRGGLCAFALTEPGAGSSPRHIGTTASIVGDNVVISGRKIWIGLADWARFIVCFARSTVEGQRGQFVAVLLDRDAPGLTVPHEHRTLGLRGIIQNTIDLEDVTVSSSRILTPGQNAWSSVASSMNKGRVGVAAMALGAMERSIQLAASYAAQRKISGKSLGEFEHVEESLERMIVRRSIVRALIQTCCTVNYTNGGPNSYLACAAKVLATEWCGSTVDTCVQILGGRGYDEANVIAKIYRDSRILRIFEGPTETMLSYLGRSLKSRATHGDFDTLFASLGASGALSELRETVVDIKGENDRELIHIGWLVALTMASAAQWHSTGFSAEKSQERIGLLEGELEAVRARVPQPRPLHARVRSQNHIKEFLEETASTIRKPTFSVDYMTMVKYV